MKDTEAYVRQVAVELATVNVVNDILFEQIRAREMHGIQHWDDGIKPDSITAELEEYAKDRTDELIQQGTVTWADIAREEWYELLNAETPAQRRTEAVQLAQVIVSWIEEMDNRACPAE